MLISILFHVFFLTEKNDEDKDYNSADDEDSDDVSEESDEESESDEEENAMNEELVELTSEISLKQKLIEELETSQKRLHIMKQQYETKLLALEARITSTQEERDKVLKSIASKPGGDSAEKTNRIKQDYQEKLTKLQGMCTLFVVFTNFLIGLSFILNILAIIKMIFLKSMPTFHHFFPLNFFQEKSRN